MRSDIFRIPDVDFIRPCVCMIDVILEFNSEIRGSHASCALMLFLCSILCLVECIFPFGMLCLFAWKMMFVKILFAICISLVVLCQRK